MTSTAPHILAKSKVIKPETFSVDESAIERIREILTREADQSLRLRVSVSGGGCSGFQYGFDLDSTIGDDDILLEHSGVEVVVDEVSMNFLRGSTLKFTRELVGAHFSIDNHRQPQAVDAAPLFQYKSKSATQQKIGISSMALIATWNVNSIGVRLEAICAWLQTSQPDVLMLQELKKQEVDLPYDAFSALGYELTAVGQKAYNGVAMIVKRGFGTLDVLHRSLPGADKLSMEVENGMQARYLEGQVAGLRLACLYLPNGNPTRGGPLVAEDGTPDEKFAYKLGWMDLLIDHARHVMATEQPFILSGDYNIIPTDLDCWDIEAWPLDALTHPDSRRRFFELTSLGLADAFRLVDHRGGQFSYWDYQKGRWQRGEGIRIDHHLISPEVADRLLSCRIDRNPRDAEKASDHTPVVLNIKS